MQGFVCKVCKFVAIDAEAPDKCPVCSADKTAFENKLEAINTPEDATGLNEKEKKHIPVIIVPEGCQDAYIKVKVGEITHPMQDEHHIVHIDLYLNKVFLGRMMLSPSLNPAAGFHLKPGAGEISCVELCNLHGAWINTCRI